MGGEAPTSPRARAAILLRIAPLRILLSHKAADTSCSVWIEHTPLINFFSSLFTLEQDQLWSKHNSLRGPNRSPLLVDVRAPSLTASAIFHSALVPRFEARPTGRAGGLL